MIITCPSPLSADCGYILRSQTSGPVLMCCNGHMSTWHGVPFFQINVQFISPSQAQLFHSYITTSCWARPWTTRGFVNTSIGLSLEKFDGCVTASALVEIMACRLFGAKPLFEPMLTYCQLDPKEHISMIFYLKFEYPHSRKCVWTCHLRNGDHFV